MMKSLSIALFGLAAACGDASERQPAAAPPTSPQSTPPATTLDDLTDPPDTPDAPVRPARPAPRGAAETLIPPGVTPVPGRALGAGEAALTFDSRTPPADLLAWYRSPARAPTFHVDSELQEGAEKVLTGTLAQARGDFTVRIAPGEHGGATAMVLVTGR